MSGAGSSRRDRRIRALRGSKAAVDPDRPVAVSVESERRIGAAPRRVAVVFLVGRECPFTCVFCDLWRSTLDGPTPAGALPRQIDLALEELGVRGGGCSGIKLYNASNFFDPLAVPDGDLEAIARRVGDFERVTVESHPRLIGERAFALARRLPGRLEVAMGLESVHPEVLPRLNKSMRVDDFDRAAAALARRSAGVRAFVLLGVPFLAPEAQVEWTLRATEHALGAGAGRVSIIPVRGGNGEMERLEALGRWSPPTLAQLEDAVELGQRLAGGIVTADLWDLELLSTCDACRERRRARLETMNLTGEIGARDACDACGWG